MVSISVLLDQADMDRLDKWRREVDPVVEREVAARQLIEIALNEVENIRTDVAPELVDTIGNGIAMALSLETENRATGGGDIADALHRLHDCFHQIGALLGVPGSQLQVIDRINAIREAPDQKN
jgi:hypothetical protein